MAIDEMRRKTGVRRGLCAAALALALGLAPVGAFVAQAQDAAPDQQPAAAEQVGDGELGEGDAPATPGEPDAPEAPAAGDSGETPGLPGADEPGEPSTPPADDPAGQPGDPSEPSEPQDPQEPSTPQEPSEPAEPSTPATPGEQPGTDEPATPSEPADQPAAAGECGVRFYAVTSQGKAAYGSLAEALSAAGAGRSSQDAPLKVALDAAHDSEHAGASLGELSESDASLALARQLAGLLKGDGSLDVSLVRADAAPLAAGSTEADELVARVALAKQAGADVVVEVHANVAGAADLACAVPEPQDDLAVVVVELTLSQAGAEGVSYEWLSQAVQQMLAGFFDPAADEPSEGDGQPDGAAASRAGLAAAVKAVADELVAYAQTAPVKQLGDAATFTGVAKTATFPDTPTDSWYMKGGYVDYVVANGLMTGYTDTGLFGPEDCVTREQVVTILYRYANPGATGTGSTSHFSDVATGQYYTAAVEWAYQNGIVTGYLGTGRFGVGDPITREDFATILYRFAQRCGAGGSKADISSFPDSGSVDTWARDALAWCNAQKIVTGDETWTPARLNPHGNTTRAQAAKMFTVLTRDVLKGSSMQPASWGLGALTASSSYVPAGGSVTVKPTVTGSGSGLTYKYMWTSSNGVTWFGSASSQSTATLKFDKTGTYTVYLQVSDAMGTAFIKTCKVVVWDLTQAKVGSNGDASWTMSAVMDSPTTSGFTYKFTWKRGYYEDSATTVGSEKGTSPTKSVTLPSQDYYWFYVKAIDPDGHEVYKAQRILYSPSGKIGWQNPSYMYQVSSYNVAPHSYSRGILSYMSPSRIGAAATRSDCVETFIARAYEYLGTSYVWNYACAPGVGVDCVGLVMQCCYAVGMDTKSDDYTNCFDPICHWDSGSSGWHSHDANNLWNYGKIQRINKSQMSRGDLVFWPGHVAIYLGDGNIIQALPSGGVYTTSLWNSTSYRYDTITGVGRLFAM